MKLSDHFDLTEFIPKEIYGQYGGNSRWFIAPQAVQIAEFFRTYFGKPIIINNWNSGGIFNYCGYRPPDCATGAKYSQHKLGQAVDLHIDGVTDYEVIRQEVLSNSAEFMKGCPITTIESGTNGWIHCDCRWTGLGNILVVPLQ